MQTTSLVPIDEYLASSYEPDCDYVDGVIQERNLGEWSHSRLQHLISRYLGNREKEWNVVISVEQRIRLSPTRIRIPDLCIVPFQQTVKSNRFPLSRYLCVSKRCPRKTAGRAWNAALKTFSRWALNAFGCSIRKTAAFSIAPAPDTTR